MHRCYFFALWYYHKSIREHFPSCYMISYRLNMDKHHTYHDQSLMLTLLNHQCLHNQNHKLNIKRYPLQTHSASISHLYIYITPIVTMIDKTNISIDVIKITIFFLPFSFLVLTIADIDRIHMVIVTKIHNIG